MASSRKAPNASATAALEAHVAREIAHHVPRRATLTVALSGGMDSVVLLEITRRVAPACAIQVRALHVNHGLSAHAGVWERFCRLHCARRRIPFRAVRVEVQGEGANVEAQARAARYRAFAEDGAPFIALAHHRDDQAETLLLNLLRGAGVEGLAAMPAVRLLDAGADDGRTSSIRLVRPLLAIARSDIAGYARERRLRWIEDDSNDNVRFARNFLRLRVLPLVERRFPAAREALARSAGHVREAALLLEELARSDASAVGAASRLNAERLAALGPSRAANVLRRFLAQHGERAPGLARTREMLRQLTDAGAHASPAIDLERHSVRRYRGWIELAPKTARAEANVLLPWHGERTLALADGGELIAAEGVGNGVSAVRLRMAPVTVRRRHGGERLRTAHARHSRTLKNLLQEAGVPPWLRGRMPLVYCGDALVWAPFVGVAAEFRAHATEASWRFRWRPAQSRELFG
jgi:tRNA(Ile)-lysidine synthase